MAKYYWLRKCSQIGHQTHDHTRHQMNWQPLLSVFVETMTPGPQTKLVQMKKVYRNAVKAQNLAIQEELEDSRDLFWMSIWAH